jgi:hypothetical protein
MVRTRRMANPPASLVRMVMLLKSSEKRIVSVFLKDVRVAGRASTAPLSGLLPGRGLMCPQG